MSESQTPVYLHIQHDERLVDKNGLLHLITRVNPMVVHDAAGNVEQEFFYFQLDGNEDVTYHNKSMNGPYFATSYVELGLQGFSLEVGKTYLTGDGYTVDIITETPDSQYICDGGRTFTYHGFNVKAGPEDMTRHIVGLDTEFVRGYTNALKLHRSDYVDASVVDVDSIPPNSNPFHYDLGNMGTDLVRGWMVMHPGFADDFPLEYLILVNTTSGQRIRIDLTKRKAQPKVISLVNGKIPPKTVCPFKNKCELAKEEKCFHRGLDHEHDFSCAIARGFEIVNQFQTSGQMKK